MINIVQGEDKTFYANLQYAETGLPFDLTGVSEITGKLPNTDKTILSVTKTDGSISVVGAPGAGRIQIDLTDAETEALAVSAEDDDGTASSDLEIIVDISGNRSIFQFPKSVLVEAQLLT